MNWYWKRKQTWKKDLITYNTHPWIMFSFNWLVIIWRGRRFTWGLLTWRRFNFGRRWARELGSWKLGNFLGRHMCIIHWIKSLLDSKYLWNCKQWTEIFFLPMKEIWKQKLSLVIITININCCLRSWLLYRPSWMLRVSWHSIKAIRHLSKVTATKTLLYAVLCSIISIVIWITCNVPNSKQAQKTICVG